MSPASQFLSPVTPATSITGTDMPLAPGDGFLTRAGDVATLVPVDSENPRAQALDAVALRQALEHSADMFFRIAEDGRVLDVNLAAVNKLGYTRTQLLGMMAHEFDCRANDARGDAQSFAEWWKKMAGDGYSVETSRYLCADGRLITVDLSIHLLRRVPANEAFCLARDITHRREAESAAEANAWQFRTYFSDSPLGIMVRDEDFRVLRVNAAYAALTGYSASELIGRDIRNLLHADDVVIVDGLAAKFALDDAPISNELRLVAKGGKVVWVKGTVNVVRDAAGRRTIVATAENITARKLFQQKLEAALQAQAAILDTTTAGVVQIKDGRIELGNQSFEHMFGYERGQLAGRHIGELEPDAGQYDAIRAGAAAAFAKGEVFQTELQLQKRTGEPIWVALQAKPVQQGAGDSSIILTFHDVTAYRHQQTRLTRLLREHRVLFEMTGVGVVHLKHRTILRCNRKMEEIFGYGPGEMVGLHASALYKEGGQSLFVDAILRNASGSQRQIELEMKRRDQSLIWCTAQSNALDPANPLAGYICTVSDITQLKQREFSLQDVLREQQVIFDNALVAIALVQDNQWVRVNGAFCRMFGYPSDEIVGANNSIIFPSDEEFQSFRQSMVRDFVEAGMSLQERRIRRFDGSLSWCMIQGSPINSASPASGIIFTMVDISVRKMSEENLARVSGFLDAIVENLPIVVAVRDVKTRRYLRFNRAGEMMTGRDRNDVIGRTPEEIYPREVADELDTLDDRVVGSREIIVTETTVSNVFDNSVRLIVRKTVPVINLADEVEYVMSLAEDVTQRVRSEQALRESETRFRQFAANINQIIFLSNPARSNFEYLNDRVSDVLGVSIDDLRRDPRSAARVVIGDDLPLLEKVRVLEEALQPADVEIRVRHPEKGLRWLRLQTFPKKSDSGGIRVFGLVADITDRKDEEQIRMDRLIEQRDVLVREVHHRIKNNLQGVAGLLQHASRSRPELKQHLDEVSTQIQAIAQVHGLQLRAGQALPLRGLARAIFDNLSRIMSHPVTFTAPAAAAGGVIDLYALPESEAVPVSLVLNELGTNAIKHGRDGARVSVVATADHVVVFEFENHGTLPAGFDYARVNNHASGIGLIKALVPRRGGAIEYRQQGEHVLVRLTLQAPAIVRLEPDNQPG